MAAVKVHQLAAFDFFSAAVFDYSQQIGIPDSDLRKIADDGVNICVTATFFPQRGWKVLQDFVLGLWEELCELALS